jgi:nucleotide-binding universal stress UspA family protein
LVNVIRGGAKSDLAALEENGAIQSGAAFKEAVKILTAAGLDQQNISTKTITGVISRAGAIVNMAEKGGWGTIVVGRRGLSSVSDFFMGRVSNKVIHAGRKDTVWVVT